MKSIIPIVCIIVLSGAVEAASVREGTQEFSISGAGSSDKEFDSNILALDATYGRYLSPESLIGIRQSVSVADVEGEDTRWNGTTRGFYDYLFTFGDFRPYVGAALGYIYGESVEESFVGGPELGFKYYVLPETFITAQMEYQFLFDDADEADNQFDDGAFVYSVGMGFNFWPVTTALFCKHCNTFTYQKVGIFELFSQLAEPLANNDTEAGRTSNRRVEILIDNSGGL